MVTRRTLLVAAFLAAVATLADAPRASAQTVASAEARWFEADFDGARAEFESILASPRLTAADAAPAHAYLAALESMGGDERAARAHAEAALALDPNASAPEGAARSVTTLFASARDRQAGRTATVTLEAEPSPTSSSRRVVTARLRSAPASLVRDLVLRCGGAERMDRAGTVTLEVDASRSTACTAEARTAAGAVLLTVTRTFDAGASGILTANSGSTTDPATRRRRRRAGWIAGSSAAVVVASVVVGVLVHRHNGDAEFGGTTVVGW